MASGEIAWGAIEGRRRVGFPGFGFAIIAESLGFETIDFLEMVSHGSGSSAGWTDDSSDLFWCQRLSW